MLRSSRLAFGFLLVGAFAGLAVAGDGPSRLFRSTPERQGMSSAALLGFVEAADSRLDSLHSFMMLRHGEVVAEGWWSPYSAESRHELYSLSKSFTSTAVGIAIAEGRMTVNDPVLAAFPDDAPKDPSANLKAMRLRDLLRMSAGHQEEPKRKPDEVSSRSFLAHPVPFKPGTHFLYNTPATFMASAMVQKATGQTVFEYLKPRLFEPMGIVDPTWDANFQGISLGGYGLSLKTEDIAKFGQLYLQKGLWQGKQLVPAAWVEEATSRQTSNGGNPNSDWDQGYGYQFWRARHNTYRGDGAHGQYCLVLPDQDAVIAITSGLTDLPGVLNLVWEKLLPDFRPVAIPEDLEGVRKLRARLETLAIRKPKGAGSSTTLARVVGKTYAFPSNEKKVESVRIEAGAKPDELAIITRVDGQEQRIELAGLDWKKQRTSTVLGERNALAAGAWGERNVAAAGAWTLEDTYHARVVLYETPYILDLDLRFAGDDLFYDSKINVRAKDPQLVGHKQ